MTLVLLELLCKTTVDPAQLGISRTLHPHKVRMSDVFFAFAPSFCEARRRHTFSPKASRETVFPARISFLAVSMILKNCGLVLNANDSRSTFLSETKAATGRFFLVKTSVSSSIASATSRNDSISFGSFIAFILYLLAILPGVTFCFVGHRSSSFDQSRNTNIFQIYFFTGEAVEKAVSSCFNSGMDT